MQASSRDGAARVRLSLGGFCENKQQSNKYRNRLKESFFWQKVRKKYQVEAVRSTETKFRLFQRVNCQDWASLFVFDCSFKRWEFSFV